VNNLGKKIFLKSPFTLNVIAIIEENDVCIFLKKNLEIHYIW